MADKQGKKSAKNPELLDLKISQTLYEVISSIYIGDFSIQQELKLSILISFATR